MTITSIGKYKTTQDLIIRFSIGIGTLPTGTIINVSQIDIDNHKFYSDEIGDWHYYSIPCEKINN